jgi:hypothetical protein
MIGAHRSATMTVPHYIGENESHMRGIHCGWYAIEDDGDLSSGPFSNREKCVRRITQPTNVTGASKLQRLLN